jgi:hypothetical protein
LYKDLDRFLHQIPDFDAKKSADLIDYFVYFLTVIQDRDAATPTDIDSCFTDAKLHKYSNVGVYLWRNAPSKCKKNPKFIRRGSGFILERVYESKLKATLDTSPGKINTSIILRDLVSRLTNNNEQTFLQEAIDCYEVSAIRASIVMVWILTMYHLYDFVLRNKLHEFNTALKSNTDKRVKISKVNHLDDFAEIPESKFIEFARSAKIISNDVRKILDIKLGIRNTSAHPSGVTISDVKATDFITDLVQNVILKYT